MKKSNSFKTPAGELYVEKTDCGFDIRVKNNVGEDRLIGEIGYDSERKEMFCSTWPSNPINERNDIISTWTWSPEELNGEGDIE